jgi:hypothetical protein
LEETEHFYGWRQKEVDRGRTASDEKFVANLWTEFSAQRSYALATNGKERKNLGFLWWLQL